MKQYFVTGTDTDCGKTHVLCSLLSYLNQHVKAQALKPVASGCEKVGDRLMNDDVTRLQRYNDGSRIEINRWQYQPPISPHLAARFAGDNLTAAQIAEFCQQNVFSVFDYLLVEGAGGLLVPLNEQETWLDFLKLTAMPVILVVGLRLGCINHALLTDAVLKANQIPCLGWVANYLDKDMLWVEENIATLNNKLHMPHIGSVYYSKNQLEFKFDDLTFL